MSFNYIVSNGIAIKRYITMILLTFDVCGDMAYNSGSCCASLTTFNADRIDVIIWNAANVFDGYQPSIDPVYSNLFPGKLDKCIPCVHQY